MPHQGRQSGGSAAARWTQGPTILLAICGTVATAAYLGAAWLSTPLAGLPAGLWTIAIAQTAMYARWRRGQHAPIAAPARTPRLDSTDIRLLAGPSLAAIGRFLSAAAANLGIGRQGLGNLRSRLQTGLDRSAWPAAPLRIGVDMPDNSAAVLAAAAPGDVRVEWIPVTGASQALMARLRLDAVAHQAPGEPLRIVTREHADRPAAWPDWSVPAPLSFGSVFPGRVDPSRVTLDCVGLSDPAEAHLVACLALASATAGRCSCRITLEDRLIGRMPSDHSARAGQTVSEFAAAMLRLAGAAQRSSREGPFTPALRTAARAAGAFFASTDSRIGLDQRVTITSAAAMALADEPEPLLRAAAMRLAACDDAAGLELLLEAEHLIRDREIEPASDQLPFLQAELELGLPSPFTLGRAAAGIALVCATSAPERLAYVRGDVMDDARYSAWLVGRDQDRAALEEVFRRLEGARPCIASIEPKQERAVA